MRGHLLLATALTLVLGSCEPEAEPTGIEDAGDVAFVEQALLLVWGRTPTSAVEAGVLVDALESVGRADFVRSLTASPEYLAFWTDRLFDQLAVNRIGDFANVMCYGVSGDPAGATGPDLASHVRDQPPAEVAWPAPFTLRDLTRSALLLDDLSPLLRAELFSLTRRGHAPPFLIEELNERSALATLFDDAYLGRDAECLPCHNSSFSVTDSGDPERDRSWPPGGNIDEPVFGDPSGGDRSARDLLFRRLGVVHAFQLMQSDVPIAPPVQGVDGGGPRVVRRVRPRGGGRGVRRLPVRGVRLRAGPDLLHRRVVRRVRPRMRAPDPARGVRVPQRPLARGRAVGHRAGVRALRRPRRAGGRPQRRRDVLRR